MISCRGNFNFTWKIHQLLRMKRYMILIILPLFFIDCNNKRTKLADDDTVAVNDFIEFFPDIKLPLEVNDKVLSRKETDSATIGYKIFSQFVPDSVIRGQFAPGITPRLFPLGKVAIKDYETYLFLKAETTSKKAGYILAFDRQKKFLAAMPLVVADKDAATSQSGVMDAKYTVTETIRKKNPEGQFYESKSVYILNSELQAFSLIMTDEGVADKKQEIINPIDTFALKNKFSGDYVKDSRNYVSVRDGKTPSTLLFFVHFEKDNGDCTGELKGEATLHGTKTAVYRANGNPCVLEFTFSGNSVRMKELDACGSYRDIRCFFDGSYTNRKKAATKKRLKAKK